MDVTTNTPVVERVAAALTASANTATSPPRAHDGEEDKRKLSWAALPLGSASPSVSSGSCSSSMQLQSTTTLRREEGRVQKDLNGGGPASLLSAAAKGLQGPPLLYPPRWQKRTSLSSMPPAATRRSSAAASTVPFRSPTPTLHGRLPSLPSTAEVAGVTAERIATASPRGSALDTDAPMPVHPLSPSPAAPPLSEPAGEAPEGVSTHSLDDAAEQNSPLPEAPTTLPADTAAALDESAVDAGDAGCGAEGDEGEDSRTGPPHTRRCGNDDSIASLPLRASNTVRPLAITNADLPTKSTEPPPPLLLPCSASVGAGEKHRERRSNAPSGFSQASPSPPVPILREPPQRRSSRPRSALEESADDSARLGNTGDSGSAKIEEVLTVDDAGDSGGDLRRRYRSYPHHGRGTADRAAAHSTSATEGQEIREHPAMHGQLHVRWDGQHTQESGTEESTGLSPQASRDRPLESQCPVRGATLTSIAAPSAGIASMAGATASGLPQQPAGRQRFCSPPRASTHAHRTRMTLSTAAPSLVEVDALINTDTVEVSSTWSSLPSFSTSLPAAYASSAAVAAQDTAWPGSAHDNSPLTRPRRHSEGAPSSSWPHALFHISEDEDESATALEGEARHSSAQAQQEQGREGRTWTDEDVFGKTTFIAVTAREILLPPPLQLAAPVREAAAVAVTPPPLHAEEHSEGTRTDAPAPAPAPPVLPTLAVAVTPKASSPTAEGPTATATSLLATLPSASLHYAPHSSSSSAPVAASPQLPTSCQQWSPPPPPPSAAAASAPLPVILENEAAATSSHGHHTALSTAAPSSTSVSLSLPADIAKGASPTAGAAATRDGREVGRAVNASASTAFVEPETVPIAPRRRLTSPVLSAPVVTLSAAATTTRGGTYREVYSASYAYINLVTSADGAGGGSECGDTIGSLVTLRSALTGRKHLPVGGVPGSAMQERTPLSMAQFSARWVSSEGGSRHGSDAGSRRSSGEGREGMGFRQSPAGIIHREGCDDNGSSYSYSYSCSCSAGGSTGSTVQVARSQAASVAPRTKCEREGAATVGMMGAACTGVVELVAYEAVTPVVGGGDRPLGWLRCGRKKATGGERTSRTEVRRVRHTAEGTRTEHFKDRSSTLAEQRMSLREREGRETPPVTTTGAQEGNFTAGSEDKAEGQVKLCGRRSSGAPSSEGSRPPRGLDSTTETPRSSERDTGGGVDDGVCETATYADRQGSMDSVAGGAIPLGNQPETPTLPLDEVEESGEGDSGAFGRGEWDEAAPAPPQQGRMPPLDLVDGAAFDSTASAPPAGLYGSAFKDKEPPLSAGWHAAVDGASAPADVAVLGREGSASENDGSGRLAVADAATTEDHLGSADGCVRGGGGVDACEGGAAATASNAVHPLSAFLVCMEELPRLRAWDAEPPLVERISRPPQEPVVEGLELKCNDTAVTTPEAAQQAFHHAVRQLTVRPLRRCVFTEVHGLRHWCLALLCLQQMPRAGLASGVTAMRAEEQRGAWGGSAPADAFIIQDPRWIDARLAMYEQDSTGERLLAAGTAFSLPSNLEARRRCLGGGGGDDGGSAEYTSTGGYERDSWSDLLVLQLPVNRAESGAEGGEQGKGCVQAAIVAATEEHKTRHIRDPDCGSGSTLSHRASQCGLAGSGLLGSLGSESTLIVKLEVRGDLWASRADECAFAATMRAAEMPSSPGTNRYSLTKDAQPTSAAASTTGDRAEGLATPPQCDEEGVSQSSVEWQTESSSPSSSLELSVDAATLTSSACGTESVRDGTRRALRAMRDTVSVRVRATGGMGAGEHAAATGTRHEECWRPLAVSPPLVPAELCRLQSDQPPLLTALGTTAEVAASAAARFGQPLPRLPCRLRWAQEPQTRPAADSEAAVWASFGEHGLLSWAPLGAAIEEYERVCRCPAAAPASPVSARGAAVSHTPTWPLTVLWNTIPSYVAVGKDKLRQMWGSSVVDAPHEWRGGGLLPKGHAMEAVTVCSVVVRSAAAILLTNEAAGVPGSGCGPPPSISVTGGCDGVVVERSAAIGGEDTHGAPVMQYNVSFHAVLTRDTASSLLFTVHSFASPAEVFGFAVWTPFDGASAAHVQQHHQHRAGGVADVWLPLFAPVSAEAAQAATIPVQPPTAAPPNTSAAARTSRSNGRVRRTSGLLLAGWLHCDVEAVFLPSLTEEAAQQLWNGPRRSLSSLAAAPGGEAETDECCVGRGIRVDDNTLMDFSVVEGAGLRPLTTHFGMPLSPTPLRWDNSANWGTDATCAHVYCEVLAVQQGTSRRALGLVPHAAGVVSATLSSTAVGAAGYRPPTSAHRRIPAASSGFDSVSCASEPGGQSRAPRHGSLSDGVEVDGELDTCGAWTGADAVLPVTASVAHTNHPRWQHTFRLGLASLSRLHLRVFDLHQHCLGGDGGDGSETTPQAAEDDTTRGCRRVASGSQAMLLGTATLSSWLLRKLLSRPFGEGCAWLPLLWSPGMAAGSETASVATNGKGFVVPHSSAAVCNGLVLVKWRRLPAATAVAWSPCCREPNSWYASVTRCWLNSNGRHATGSEARTRSSLRTCKRLQEVPQIWYPPMVSQGSKPRSMTAPRAAYSRQPGWMSPEVEPWLQIYKARLQWPWLQHLLCMHGGQARLSLRYPTAEGEARLLAQCLLVPLCELAEPSTSAVCGGQPSHVNSRRPRDSAAVYGMVLSTPPAYSAAPPTNSAAPMEATLYLPASPSIEVQVWWYPRDSVGTTGARCLDAPPRFIGRGEWRFPAYDVAAAMQGLTTGAERGVFDEALNAPLTMAGAAGLPGLSGEEEEEGSAVTPASLPTSLRSFFILHEADVRVAPVHSTGLPQHVEGGVLTWRVMSFPRLLCADWGKVPPAMLSWAPGSPSCVAGQCFDLSHPSRTSPGVRPVSTWAMPDAGTPARVHMEVCDIICFDRVDAPRIDAAQATEAVQIAVSASTSNGSPSETSFDDSAAIAESRCWVYPRDVPPPDAPSMAFAFSAACDATANWEATWSNTGGDEKSAARNAVSDAGASRFPAVEVQWPPRRFGWVDDVPPSLYVWLMAPSRSSGGAAAAVGSERVWGVVRLAGLEAFTSHSGTLWLPLFRSSVAPSVSAEVPRCPTAAEDVVTSSCSGSGTGEHVGVGSPPPQPSTVERTKCGVPVTAPPQSDPPCGDKADPLLILAAPCAGFVVKHVGFVEVRYAHNMQRRADVEVTSCGTKLSAAPPRVLLASVGPLHRRFPASASARGPSDSSASPSPSESYAPVLEALPAPPPDAAQMALAAAADTADAAAAVGVYLHSTRGGTEVLLGVEAHQLSMRLPDADMGRDESNQESMLGSVAVFPLPRRSCGDGGLRRMRLQARVGASAAIATRTMYFDPGDVGETAESAQWVPLSVRRRLHDAHGIGYDGEGDSVVAEILVRWRVVNFSAAAASSRSTVSPLSLQRLVREHCGGSGASCSYTVLSALSATDQLHQSLSRQDRADVQQRAYCSKLPGKGPKEHDTMPPALASRALSRVLRTIEPQRHRCVYLRLDQLLLQCSTRQRLAWAALQRGPTAPPQEMLADGEYGGDVSVPLRFRLEVQLRWPAEWCAVWRRAVPPSPERVLLRSEAGAAASWTPAATDFATATAGATSLNVWLDSAEGVFAESGASTAPGAAVGDEAAAYAAEERLFSCASLPPLCLVLPSPQDIERALGEPGLAARFSLAFALFSVAQGRGDRDFPAENASDVCVGAGRTPMKFTRSVQFGLTSLLPSASSMICGTSPCADAVDADVKDDMTTMPALLRWRARVTESLPVLPPGFSRSCISPSVRDLAAGSGKAVGDGAAGCGEQMPSWSLSSPPASSFTKSEEAIEDDGHTRATGPADTPVLARTPALARVSVTGIQLCGVDVSLAGGVAQRHLGVLPPAMVTLMVADIAGTAAAPTERRGGGATTAPTVYQLLPRLLLFRPTAASAPVDETSTVSLPMARPPPPQQQRYMWSTDVCLTASISTLVFNVSVPYSALRLARAEETWLPPRSPLSEVEPQDADAQAADARWRSRHIDWVNVSGRAVYALDLSAQAVDVRPPCDGRLVSAAQTTGEAREVVLEVESLVHGRWLGRLWVQVDVTAADLLMRDAASVFFTSRMTLTVQSCSGFAVGDVPLTCRVEETYARLRERAALLLKQRGRVPRRLRQEMKEIHQIRRELRQGHGQQCDGALADHGALSMAGVLRVTSAWGEQGAHPLQTLASKPFALPTATELVRQGRRAATRPASTGAPLLCTSRDINTAPVSEGATATVWLELCEASSGVAVASGQMVLPLHSARTLWRKGAWQPPVSTVTSPLTMRVALQPCAMSAMRSRRVRPVSPSAGAADVTAAWSVYPARGDAWLTCIFVKPTAGSDGAAMSPQRLLLRWVYCFESTAYPETEHAVDMPLRLRLSSTASDHGGRGAQMPHAGHHLSDGVPVFWSGVAMRLPRIGSVGATLKRVQLLEMTPVSCAHLLAGGAQEETAQPSPLEPTLPARSVCMTTQLAVHEWSVEDELRFETRRRQAQKSGEDSLMWLTCEGVSDPNGGHCRCGYEVLLGLSTSNSLAKCAAKLLEQRKVRTTGNEESLPPPEPANQSPRLHPRVGASVLATHGAARPVKADKLPPPPTPHKRFRDSTSSTEGGAVRAAAGSGGGVVMRALKFQCSGAALAALEWGQIDTLTCCVVALRRGGDGGATLSTYQSLRSENMRGAADCSQASFVVLDAGRATSFLQEHCSTEDPPCPVTTSLPPPLSSALFTAAWSHTLALSASTVVAPCAVAAASSAGAHHSMQEPPSQTGEDALLRVVLPLDQPDPVLAAVGDGGEDDVGSDSGGEVTAVSEEQFCIEVAVRGRRCGAGAEAVVTAARYVSAPFRASDILRSARSCGERSGVGGRADAPAAVAGSDSQLQMPPSHWSSILAMHLVSASASEGWVASSDRGKTEKEPEAGLLTAWMAPTAVIEVTWTLDVLGVLRARASAAGVVLTPAECSRCRADRDPCHEAEHPKLTLSSVAGKAEDTDDDDDDDDDVGSGGMSMRQLEAYSAWFNFLKAQHGMGEMQAAQAKLRHWRCTIVGVEVSGIELPLWCSTGDEISADAGDEVYDAAHCTSLLSQLVLPIGAPSTAAGADADRQPKQDSDSAGRHRRRCLRSKGGLVVGVARTTLTRMDSGACLGTGAAANSSDDATVEGDRRGARPVAPVRITSSRPRSRQYAATFTPLSWTMAVKDMIAQATAAEHVAKEKTTARAVGRASAAGLTVWQLLAHAPTQLSSARNSVNGSHVTTQETTQLAYNLGSARLARLLHEIALYLVQVLARWCGGVYTTKERDVLLETAALYPTQWMPLVSAKPLMNGARSEARVRFKCAYSYHGPMLLLPKSPATVLPPRITAPCAVADAVFCAQLNHVQFTCTNLDGAGAVVATAESHCPSGACSAAAWLSRLTLVIRVLITTESTVDGAVVDSRCVAQWHTRLAPVPCDGALPITGAVPEKGRVAPSVSEAAPSATLQAVAAPTLPMTVAVSMPDAVPVPVTAAPSSGERTWSPAELLAKRVDEDDNRVAAATVDSSSAAGVVPLLPTTFLCCWQPSRLTERTEGYRVGQSSAAVPAASATETTTTSVETVLVLLPDEKAEEVDGSAAVAGTVVGRAQVRVGCSSSSEVAWDAAEERVESGWRLGAPLSVRLPVTAEAALPRRRDGASACAVSPAGGQKGSPQPCSTISFDLLVFTAPSTVQVAALEASRAAHAEERRCSWSALQRVEEALVALAVPYDHLHDQARKTNADACATTAGEPQTTLGQLSHTWVSQVPYRLLRAPPTVIRVDTFDVWDGVPSSPERRAAASSAGGNGESSAAQLFQMLWTMPQRSVMQRTSSHVITGDLLGPSRSCSWGSLRNGTCNGAMSVEVRAWLVDEQTGEVRAPVWTLLSSGPSVLQNGDAASRTPSRAPSLAFHLHSGRAILQDTQRLRLDWRSGDEGDRRQSASLLAALAGLLGGASVAYTAADGSACLWVSGGLRRSCSEGTLHSTSLFPMLQGGDVDGNSGGRAADPVPPLSRYSAHHRSRGRRRVQQPLPPRAAVAPLKPSSRVPSPGAGLRAASCSFDYVLYASHFLSWTATAPHEQAVAPGLRCAVHTPAAWSLSAASPGTSAVPRLFHSATLVGGRVWLLGGWAAPAGVETLPSTSAALVSTAGLVERRRREVRRAVTHIGDNGAAGDRLSPAPLAGRSCRCTGTSASNAHCKADSALCPASLTWCDEAHSVQFLDDGFPAPPVSVPSPPSQEEDCAVTTGATSCWLAKPPRLACHVAVSCGDRCVALFGGMLASTGTDDDAPVATAAVHTYDTIQGRWSAQYEPDRGTQGEWPVARYGHCVTPVPGTDGVRQPRSYFVFGGATTTPSCRTLLVPPAQLLWIWTPVLGVIRCGSSGAFEIASVHSTWQRVQLPVGLSTPLAGRFLSQLHAYSAAEVAAAVRGATEPVESGALAPSDPGLTSMVLCVAGGMTAPTLAQDKVPGATGNHAPHTTKAASSGAYGTFCECVEPWFAHPVRGVTSVLLRCVCELQPPPPRRR
ncbi:hypothetical protein CUR178_05213 [Leishmania enriettii]|uniref:Uncharacterized protein n=1 Tax=Leishmania enriettii TaxID=5663 RepID=A0A836GPA1_LEIEN|nr:hypothetical protein CUR178_05213 [Leishmania enriettii]